MPPPRVWLLCHFSLKRDLHFALFGLGLSLVFRGTKGVYECICRFNRDLKHRQQNGRQWSRPRHSGPRVSLSAGKTKFKQCSFPDRQRLFLCEELCLVTVLLWGRKRDLHAKSVVLYLRFRDNGKPPWISSSTKAGQRFDNLTHA